MILGTALLLLAAAPAPDYSWLIDSEIPGRIAAAQAEATRLDATAAESDRLRKDVLGRRQAALDEKAKLEPTLPTLSRGKKTAAEARIKELEGIAVAQATRAKQLEAQAASQRGAARAQRDFGVAAAREAKVRAADDAKFGLPSDADYTGLSDARLIEVRAWHQRRMARVPKQLAHLDEALEQATSTGDRGDVVERKEAIRSIADVDEAEVLRITDELRFRVDSKTDEDILAQQMAAAAKAKESDRATPEATPTAAGQDPVDAMLDRVIAQQDREKADAESSSKTIRAVGRIAGAVAGFGALGTALFFVFRRN